MEQYATLDATYVPPAIILVADEPYGWKNTVTRYILQAVEEAPGTHVKGSSSKGEGAFYERSSLPVLTALKRLRAFKGWERNWDAEGAPAPDGDTLEAATKVLGLLAVYAVPQVGLDSEGRPMLTFDGDLRGEVTVTTPQTLDYFFEDADLFGYETPFDGLALPGDLIALLRQSA